MTCVVDSQLMSHVVAIVTGTGCGVEVQCVQHPVCASATSVPQQRHFGCAPDLVLCATAVTTRSGWAQSVFFWVHCC